MAARSPTPCQTFPASPTSDPEAGLWNDFPQRQRGIRSVTQAYLDWIVRPPLTYWHKSWEYRIELTHNPYAYSTAELIALANRLLPRIEDLQERCVENVRDEEWANGEEWWAARDLLLRLEAKWDAIAAEVALRKKETRRGTSGSAPGSGRSTSTRGPGLPDPDPADDPFLTE